MENKNVLTPARNEDKEREHAREPRLHPRENWDAAADLSAVQHVLRDEGGFGLARALSSFSSLALRQIHTLRARALAPLIAFIAG